jgi:hypothetical protein
MAVCSANGRSEFRRGKIDVELPDAVNVPGAGKFDKVADVGFNSPINSHRDCSSILWF